MQRPESHAANVKRGFTSADPQTTAAVANAAWTHEQLLDSIKTRLQRDGRATFGAHLTVAELAEIASDLGFGLNEIVVSGWGNYATKIAVKR